MSWSQLCRDKRPTPNKEMVSNVISFETVNESFYVGWPRYWLWTHVIWAPVCYEYDLHTQCIIGWLDNSNLLFCLPANECIHSSYLYNHRAVDVYELGINIAVIYAVWMTSNQIIGDWIEYWVTGIMNTNLMLMNGFSLRLLVGSYRWEEKSNGIHSDIN